MPLKRARRTQRAGQGDEHATGAHRSRSGGPRPRFGTATPASVRGMAPIAPTLVHIRASLRTGWGCRIANKGGALQQRQRPSLRHPPPASPLAAREIPALTLRYPAGHKPPAHRRRAVEGEEEPHQREDLEALRLATFSSRRSSPPPPEDRGDGREATQRCSTPSRSRPNNMRRRKTPKTPRN